MKTNVLGAVLISIASMSALAAENAWTGHWKLDAAHSQFAGNTVTYSKGPGALLHFSDDSTIQYDFGLDGKEYRAGYGRTTAWTAAGPNAWDQVAKIDGRVLMKSHRSISADGKTMTIHFKGSNPDGSALDEEDVYTRVSGTTGLIGTWRSTKVAENSPASFVISSTAPGTLHYDLPEQKASVEGAADGSDHVINGPNIPPGMTIGYKLSGNRIDYTIKVNGAPDTYGIQTMAPDGSSFTDVSWNPGKENEKQTAVYRKQ